MFHDKCQIVFLDNDTKCVQNVSKIWTHFGHTFAIFPYQMMCPKCVHNISKNLDTLWTHFGRILDAFWNHHFLWKNWTNVFKVWTHYGHIFGHIWSLDMFWTDYGHIFDTFGFGHIMDRLWTYYGHFSKISVQNVSIHTL